jgi:DNA-binding MarR family transcriptional regulator
MTTAPTLTGQDIGQAERATRALLDELLVATGLRFDEWVIINLLATHDGAPERAAIESLMARGLHIPPENARDLIDEVVRRGLVVPIGRDTRITLTRAGRARFRSVRAGIDRITERLYGGISADDLATTHRVLAAVTERANAALTDD